MVRTIRVWSKYSFGPEHKQMINVILLYKKDKSGDISFAFWFKTSCKIFREFKWYLEDSFQLRLEHPKFVPKNVMKSIQIKCLRRHECSVRPYKLFTNTFSTFTLYAVYDYMTTRARNKHDNDNFDQFKDKFDHFKRQLGPLLKYTRTTLK